MKKPLGHSLRGVGTILFELGANMFGLAKEMQAVGDGQPPSRRSARMADAIEVTCRAFIIFMVFILTGTEIGWRQMLMALAISLAWQYLPRWIRSFRRA
ncbi:MAG: hypothetical protein EON58_07710 [Alphaproteobacteria bacterium]|nr:MAG: hypothetical protein EON58_07710 [Alphaproteobacteria bacterium]